MNRHKVDDKVDMSGRLRQLQQLLEAPIMVAPRAPADDAPEALPPLIAVDAHVGHMYVAGHEPHFRRVMLLQHGHDAAPEPS